MAGGEGEADFFEAKGKLNDNESKEEPERVYTD